MVRVEFSLLEKNIRPSTSKSLLVSRPLIRKQYIKYLADLPVTQILTSPRHCRWYHYLAINNKKYTHSYAIA